MEYHKHKDLSLSEIGVGCYALSGVYGSRAVECSKWVVQL
jgi:hypothetical protein